MCRKAFWVVFLWWWWLMWWFSNLNACQIPNKHSIQQTWSVNILSKIIPDQWTVNKVNRMWHNVWLRWKGMHNKHIIQCFFAFVHKPMLRTIQAKISHSIGCDRRCPHSSAYLLTLPLDCRHLWLQVNTDNATQGSREDTGSSWGTQCRASLRYGMSPGCWKSSIACPRWEETSLRQPIRWR